MTILAVEKHLLLFFCCSVLGYVAEVLYCSVAAKRFVNRGFLSGPYLPIYGFGGLAITIFSASVPLARGKWVFVFLFSFVSSSVIEYIGSWFLEKCFHVKLWDYGGHKFNINGRVCLLNSTLFGLFGLLFVFLLKPLLFDPISKIPQSVIHPLALTILVILSVDTTASTLKMLSFSQGLEELKHRRKLLDEKLALVKDELGEAILERFRRKSDEELTAIRSRFVHRNHRLVDAFPSMTLRNRETKKVLEQIKAEIIARLRKK